MNFLNKLMNNGNIMHSKNILHKNPLQWLRLSVMRKIKSTSIHMKKATLLCLLLGLAILTSCNSNKTAIEILNRTIESIDTIESIYFKQDMIRSNPRQFDDTLFRYREMYFKRLIEDSIVGVKGHWYMYANNTENIAYEYIYDGKRLLRMNNKDSVVLINDLERYPEFKEKFFWAHNTLYGMQFEFKYALENQEFYKIERENDTLINGIDCYQLLITLEDKTTMPGFFTSIEESEGTVFRNLYFITKATDYPIRMISESFSKEYPEQVYFMVQNYYDIEFNLEINEKKQFNTSMEELEGFDIKNLKP